MWHTPCFFCGCQGKEMEGSDLYQCWVVTQFGQFWSPRTKLELELGSKEGSGSGSETRIKTWNFGVGKNGLESEVNWQLIVYCRSGWAKRKDQKRVWFPEPESDPEIFFPRSGWELNPRVPLFWNWNQRFFIKGKNCPILFLTLSVYRQWL